MDYTILIVISIVAAVVGFTFLAKYFRVKKLVDVNDLIFAMQVLQLGIEVVDELNLTKEKQIKTISNIVLDAVDYTVKTMQEGQDNIEMACGYAYAVCFELNIELTEERKQIIRELITLSFSKL